MSLVPKFLGELPQKQKAWSVLRVMPSDKQLGTGGHRHDKVFQGFVKLIDRTRRKQFRPSSACEHSLSFLILFSSIDMPAAGLDITPRISANRSQYIVSLFAVVFVLRILDATLDIIYESLSRALKLHTISYCLSLSSKRSCSGNTVSSPRYGLMSARRRWMKCLIIPRALWVFLQLICLKFFCQEGRQAIENSSVCPLWGVAVRSTICWFGLSASFAKKTMPLLLPLVGSMRTLRRYGLHPQSQNQEQCSTNIL